MNLHGDRPDSSSVDLDVDRVLREYDVPGCSAAVLDEGEIVLNRGFGTSSVSSGAPLTAATRMQACSMSKPVAVVAALRLVEQGLLDLDADVSQYLSRWTLPANGDWRPRLTLRQLASHTAGLTSHAGFPGYRRGEVVPSLVEVLGGTHPANAPGARVDMAPGLQFRYSGAGTTLIQLLMEEVTGTSATELLSQLVLEPLDMRESTFVQDIEDPARAHGHLPGQRPVPGGWRVQPEQCAAGLWTTAADYLRFLQGVQRAYAGGTDEILAPATAREMLRPLAALPSGRDMTGMTHIGLGFFLTVQDGEPTWFGHTGSNVGFVCASMASVSGRQGAVVMTNGDDGVPVVRTLLQSIARVHRRQDTNFDGNLLHKRAARLGSHAGSYGTGEGLVIELGDDDGQVALTVPGQAPIRLRFDDPATLSTEDLDLRVLMEADGSISLEQGGQTTRLRSV